MALIIVDNLKMLNLMVKVFL